MLQLLTFPAVLTPSAKASGMGQAGRLSRT